MPNRNELINELEQQQTIDAETGEKSWPVTTSITDSINQDELAQLKTTFFDEFKDHIQNGDLEIIFSMWEYVALKENDMIELKKHKTDLVSTTDVQLSQASTTKKENKKSSDKSEDMQVESRSKKVVNQDSEIDIFSKTQIPGTNMTVVEAVQFLNNNYST